MLYEPPVTETGGEQRMPADKMRSNQFIRLGKLWDLPPFPGVETRRWGRF
jgi:hypothetical protein